jgi:arsenate reductase-like glutaredoxin family protein
MLINAIIEKPILLQRPIILLKEIGIGMVARSEESLNQLMTRIKEDLI